MSNQKDTKIVSISEAIENGFGVISVAPLQIIVDQLEQKGFIYNPDKCDSNGWQVDFWVYFNHPELGEWQLAGSLWYGDYHLSKVK